MPLNEQQIQAIVDKHGISRTEVEELIKTSDFTDDAFKTDKERTKWNMTSALAKAYHVWQMALKAGDRETPEGQELIDRAAKVYWDLKSYITEDFTDDKAFSKEKQLTKKKILASLVEAVTVFRSTNDAKVKDRARKLYVELQEFITSSDFTDDGSQFNESMLRELSQAWHQYMMVKDPKTAKRAQKLYHDLLDYLLTELNKKK